MITFLHRNWQQVGPDQSNIPRGVSSFLASQHTPAHAWAAPNNETQSVCDRCHRVAELAWKATAPPLHVISMETVETFLPIFWVAFAPPVVLVVVIAAEWISDQIVRRA